MTLVSCMVSADLLMKRLLTHCWRYAFPFEGKSPFNGFAMVLQPRPVWELNGGIHSDSWKFD